MLTSKSCIFCIGIKFFFPHLTVSWSLPVTRIIFLRCYACNTLWGSGRDRVSSQIQSGGFTNLPCKSGSAVRNLFWKNKISFAEEVIAGNIIKSSYKSTVGSVSHLEIKYFHSLIILTSFQISRGFLLPDWNLKDSLLYLTCDVRLVSISFHININSARFLKKWCCFLFFSCSLKACNSILVWFFLFAG